MTTNRIIVLLVILAFVAACQSSPTMPPTPGPTPPKAPLPTLSIYTNEPTIHAGDRCQLNFATDGNAMVLKNGTIILGTYSRPANYTGNWGVAHNEYPVITTTYTVTATNDAGSVSKSITITVQ